MNKIGDTKIHLHEILSIYMHNNWIIPKCELLNNNELNPYTECNLFIYLRLLAVSREDFT